MNALLIVALIHLVSVASPGPDFAMVTKNALTASRKAGLLTVAGITAGIMVHLIYSFLGIGVVISNSIVLFNVIKYLGAIYLIYIGLKSLLIKDKNLAKQNVDVELETEETRSYFYYFKLGFLTNLLNPKAAVYFVSLFSQFIHTENGIILNGLFGLEVLMITFSWFAFVTIALSNNKVKAKFRNLKTYIDKAFGVALVALGIRISLEAK